MTRIQAVRSIGFFLIATTILSGCKNDIGGPNPPGPTWVTFTSPRLPDNRVNSLFIDRQQRVWVATNKGAAAFKNNSWSIFKDSLKYTGGGQQISYSVNCITESRDRSIWFGLRGGGIARYDEFSQNGNIWVRYHEPTILYDSPSSMTAELSNASQFGEVWIATQIGVNRFIQTSTDGGGTWSVLTGPPLPVNNMTSATTNPVDNTIWLGAQSGGAVQVSYYPSFAIATIPLPPGHDARINCMVFDANNTVWFAKETEVSSLSQATGAWTHYNHTNTAGMMPVGEVHAVETDLYNTHWFGTDAGLVMLKDTTWQRFNAGTNTIPNDTVTSLKYDLRGNLWIGTRNGVAAYNPAGTQF